MIAEVSCCSQFRNMDNFVCIIDILQVKDRDAWEQLTSIACLQNSEASELMYLSDYQLAKNGADNQLNHMGIQGAN